MTSTGETYTVSVSGDHYVVTYVSGSVYLSPIINTGVETASNATDIIFGSADHLLQLPWRNETSLSATSRADLITKIRALSGTVLEPSSYAGLAQTGRAVTVIGLTSAATSSWGFCAFSGITQPTSAVALSVGSNDANDDSAGLGARTVLIEGLDSTGAEVSETVALTGLGIGGPTTQTFLRVNNVTVATAGTDRGVNYGPITVYNGANTYSVIGYADTSTPGATYGAGVSADAVYTVPTGYKGYIVGAQCHASTSGEWAIFTRKVDTSTPPYNPRVVVFKGYRPSAGQGYVHFREPIVVEPLTDIMARVAFSVANVAVVVQLFLVPTGV